MKNKFIQKISLGAALLLLTSNTTFAQAPEQSYTPTPENMKARQEFQDNKFGIFLHVSMPLNGYRPSKPQVPNISVLPAATTTVSRCSIPKNQILIL